MSNHTPAWEYDFDCGVYSCNRCDRSFTHEAVRATGARMGLEHLSLKEQWYFLSPGLHEHGVPAEDRRMT